MSSQRRDEALAAAFGARVRSVRVGVGLSQEALAERARVHRTFVGHIERGESSPTLVTIVRLAEALGVDPGDLVCGLHVASAP